MTRLLVVLLIGSCISVVSSYELGPIGEYAGEGIVGPRIPPFLKIPGLLNFGECLDVPSVPLDSNTVQMIMGPWYATGWTGPAFLTSLIQCPAAVISVDKDNVARIDATVRFLYRRLNATVAAGINEDGDIEIKMPGKSGKGIPLKIIGTDREEYAVLYTCIQLNPNFYIDAAVLATRDAGSSYFEAAADDLLRAGVQGKSIVPIRCG